MPSERTTHTAPFSTGRLFFVYVLHTRIGIAHIVLAYYVLLLLSIVRRVDARAQKKKSRIR